MPQKESLTLGILAHVDAGKTSLSECLLYKSGTTKTQGSVDKGSAITDALEIEKNRGISIKSATVNFVWQEKYINLVDTPGHIDFSAEVDRVLSILDMVILVVSAKEGVQAHTLNLWQSIVERNLPVLIFVNKIDRAGVDLEQVFSDLQKDLETKLFALNYGDTTQSEIPKLIDFLETKPYFSTVILEKSFENLAEFDEGFLEDYLEENINDLTKILAKTHTQLRSQNLVPLIFGSAKLDLGIDLILASLTLFKAKNKLHTTPSAKVFKVVYDSKKGVLAHIKSYGSLIKAKDVIWSQSLQKTIKINQIFKQKLANIEQVTAVNTGEIAVISTSDLIQVGDVLGKESFEADFAKLAQTVLTVQAVAQEEKEYQKLGEALEILNIEDPQLNFQWFKEEREFHLKILGTIQTEVLKDSIVTRFGIGVNFLSPKVIYKETPKKVAQGYVRYWMPKPCWAIMTFLIEPAPLGTGVTFTSKVRTSDISVKYQNEIKRAIPWTLKQGIKGWEVTDIHITLLEGSEHSMHSNSGDFLLATPMGILRGLELADTDLLAPMYRFEIKAKQDLLGAISSDLNQMKAQLNPPMFEGDFFTISGKVSVEKAMNYSIKFNATTSGKGRLKLTIDGYQKTSTSKEKIRPYKGVSPLNEAQWILHKRGAFKADEQG